MLLFTSVYIATVISSFASGKIIITHIFIDFRNLDDENSVFAIIPVFHTAENTAL